MMTSNKISAEILKKEINTKKSWFKIVIDQINITNVEESLSPILWLSRIGGVSCFEKPDGKPRIKLTVFYACIRVVTYSLLAWYGGTISKSSGDVTLSYIIFVLVKYINVAILIISTILGLYNYKEKAEFIHKLSLIDETLEIFGIDPQYPILYQKNLKIILIWCCGGFILISNGAIICYYLYMSVQAALTRVFLFHIPLLNNSIVGLHFIINISNLKERFEKINTLLNQRLTTIPLEKESLKFNEYKNILRLIMSKNSDECKNKNNIKFLLLTARQLHLSLCITSRETNKAFNKQITIQMASMLIMLCGFLYSSYLFYKEPKIPTNRKIQHCALLLFFIILGFSFVVYIIRTLVMTTAEAQKVSYLAHEINVSESQSKIIDEIHQFSLQTLQHPLYFSASGLFILDFFFMRAFIGTITTSLMILIQNQPNIMKAAESVIDTSVLTTKVMNVTISSVL